MSEDSPDYGGQILRVRIGDREIDANELKRALRNSYDSPWTSHFEEITSLLGLGKPEYIRE